MSGWLAEEDKWQEAKAMERVEILTRDRNLIISVDTEHVAEITHYLPDR